MICLSTSIALMFGRLMIVIGKLFEYFPFRVPRKPIRILILFEGSVYCTLTKAKELTVLFTTCTIVTRGFIVYAE